MDEHHVFRMTTESGSDDTGSGGAPASGGGSFSGGESAGTTTPSPGTTPSAGTKPSSTSGGGGIMEKIRKLFSGG
jgi:hypothetical protein